MQLLQQSEATAAQRRIFFHAVDATDGITAETGLTGAGRISKNGAATAASTANVSEVDSTNMPGRYYIELTAAELDTVGILEFRFKAAACAEVVARGQVVPFDPYDAVRAGLTALPNAAADAAGGLPISDAGGLDVDAQRADVAAILVDTGTTLDGRIPAALVGGKIDANVGAISADTVAADNAEAFFDGTGYAGTGNTIPTVTTVNGLAAGVVTAAAIANGAIDAATFAAGAIDAAALAADASAEIADQVWDEAIAGHLGAGSTGLALNSAGAAGDPWSTALPGAYGAGTAGKIVGDNVNATISSRASQASLDVVDDFLDTEVAAIKAKTDQLTFTAANKVDSSLQAATDVVAAVANKIADHVLRRTYANARASADGDAVNFRSLLGAIGKLVNKWAISGATLTVYQEDDVTATAPGGTQAITATAGADPITTLDTT